MLGIAGAYLLRALAASGVLPRILIAGLAIAYAIGWLVAASRTKAQARFAGALYASTSALILAPMLWELTMRFQVLAPAASAAVLGLVVAVATALNWERPMSSDFLVTYAAVALTALALSVVTHVMMPFLLLLLLMIAMCEYKSLRTGGQGSIRALVAVVADCAVWFLIVIYRNPASSRSDYPALGTLGMLLPASLLFAYYGTERGDEDDGVSTQDHGVRDDAVRGLVSPLGHDPAVPRSAIPSPYGGHCLPVVCVSLLRGGMGNVPRRV